MPARKHDSHWPYACRSGMYYPRGQFPCSRHQHHRNASPSHAPKATRALAPPRELAWRPAELHTTNATPPRATYASNLNEMRLSLARITMRELTMRTPDKCSSVVSAYFMINTSSGHLCTPCIVPSSCSSSIALTQIR